ncbi:MAG: hypothetical protein HYR56_19030 [Acidobacteria bacterium]|nr:hypothetical protein [Acidobacteriota bacterium]MBI3426733.1 hypothetical protein [Acidobacteriota bacterium]
MQYFKMTVLALAVLLAGALFVPGRRAGAQNPLPVGERPTLAQHLNQAEIESGKYPLPALLEIGEEIFAARWNALDGQGRPSATGNGAPTKRDLQNNVPFLRTSGPDASSCADCHSQPFVGGAGGFVANVFVLAQVADPIVDSVSAEFSNERNTLGLNGSGAIEMLAREMTEDLLSLRQTAILRARSAGRDMTIELVTKGVSFGELTASPNGVVNTSKVEGVDADLIIKPFHQKGVVNSVRVFTVNAYNHHHGMEAVERFGSGQKDVKGNVIDTADFDGDGVKDELSVGDITAATLFQAAMNVPGRVMSSEPTRRAAAQRGEDMFGAIGCIECHRPTLVLRSRLFTEPNPYNPAGNLRPQDVQKLFSFDLTSDIPGPALEAIPQGGAVVRAFTDLKRHVICDSFDPFYCNERKIQSGVPTDQFLTRKLWDVGNTAPYGHRGDLTTITDAIMHHAGEARASRNNFAELSRTQQDEIVEFLKQLQILPNGAPREITDVQLRQSQRRQSQFQQ